jgi:hypothetical protein
LSKTYVWLAAASYDLVKGQLVSELDFVVRIYLMYQTVYGLCNVLNCVNCEDCICADSFFVY